MLANATGEVFRLAKTGVVQASFTLLTFPVPLLGRIRRLSAGRYDLHSNEVLLSQPPPPPISTTPLPGPWSFLTSWYVFGLIMMVCCGHE
jgi:hypothetical protein